MADITRIYEIKVDGVVQALNELSLISTTFDELDRQWKALLVSLKSAKSTGDANLVDELQKKIVKLTAELDKLKLKQSELTKETSTQLAIQKSESTQLEVTRKSIELLIPFDAKRVDAMIALAREQKKQTDAEKQGAEATKTAVDSSKTRTDAAGKEAEKVLSLAQQIGNLRKQRELFEATGKPIVFEEKTITSDEALTKINELLDVKKKVKLEEQQSKVSTTETTSAINIQANAVAVDVERLDLLNVRLAKLNALRQAFQNPVVKTIQFEGNSFTQTQASDEAKRILTLQQEIKNEIALTEAQKKTSLTLDAQSVIEMQKQREQLDLDVKSQKQLIDELVKRKQLLQEAIALSASKQQQFPLATNVPITFEDRNIKLTQANKLENDISSSIAIQKTNLDELLVKQTSVNKAKQDEQNIIKSSLIIEEGSQAALEKQIKDLDKLIAARTQKSVIPVGFEGDTRTVDELKAKREELIQLLRKEEEGNLTNEEILKRQLTEFDKLVADRKELVNLTQSAILKGDSTVEFQGSTLSTQEAVRLAQQKKIQEQQLIDLFKVEKGIHDQTNIAAEESNKRNLQDIKEIQQVLSNTGKNETSTTFRGQSVDVKLLQQALAQLQSQTSAYTAEEKLRKQAIDIVDNSMNQLKLDTKILESAVGNLTIKNDALRLSFTQEQWEKYSAALIPIVPELAKFSLEEVNAGKAGDLLKTIIFDNNAVLRQQKLELSGTNTLIGDYSKGIVDAFKNNGITDALTRQRSEIQNSIVRQTVTIADLTRRYNQLGVAGGDAFDKVRAEMNEAIKTQARLQENLKRLDTSFNNTGSIGSQITGSISAGFEKIGKQIIQTLSLYIGFQAAISGLRQIIQVNKELSDSYADLQRILGATEKQTGAVIAQLRQIDTRTSLPVLVGFAEIAARAGVATDKIAGVTSAINKLELIAGKELGNIDEATTSIVKLINIFEGPGKVSEQTVLNYGNALVKLANESVATGGFLVNFAERLAGVQGISKIGISNVLGLASAFENTGATAEIAATSISQILLRVGIDIQKYAKLAQVPLETFREILRNNPAEALIQLAQGLTKNGVALDEFGSKFGDLAAKGVRVTTIFGNIAANADFFRQQIQLSSQALQDQSTILEGAENKQKTFAASLDKISALFTEAFSSPEFVKTLDNIGVALLRITRLIVEIPFNAILTGVSLLSAAYLVFQGIAVKNAIAQQLNNDQSLIGIVRNRLAAIGIGQTTAAIRAKAAALGIETPFVIASRNATAAAAVAEAAVAKAKAATAEVTRLRNAATVDQIALDKALIIQEEALTEVTVAQAEATRLAKIAMDGLNVSTKASPIGILLSLLLIFIPTLSAFGAKLDDTTKKIEDQNDALSAQIDLQGKIKKEIADSVTETKDRVQALISIIKDETNSLEIRKAAYNKLIEISPTFVNTLDDQFRATNKLTTASDDLIKKLNELAVAQAFKSLKDESLKNLSDVDLKIIKTETTINELTQSVSGDIDEITRKALSDATAKELKDLDDRAKAANERATLASRQKVTNPKTAFDILKGDLQGKQIEDEKELLKQQDDLDNLKKEEKQKQEKLSETQKLIDDKTKETIDALDVSKALENQLTDDSQDVIDAKARTKTRTEQIDKLDQDITNLQSKRSRSSTTDQQKQEIDVEIGKKTEFLQTLKDSDKKDQDIINEQSGNLLRAKEESKSLEQQIFDISGLDLRTQKEQAQVHELSRDEALAQAKLDLQKNIQVSRLETQNLIAINEANKGLENETRLAKESQKRLDELEKERNQIKKQIKILQDQKAPGSGRIPAITTSFDQNDLRAIDAERDRELTLEKLKFTEIESLRKASFQEEVDHLQKEQEINERFDNLKIDQISRIHDTTLFLEAKFQSKSDTRSKEKFRQFKEDASREELEIAKLQVGIFERQIQNNDKLQSLRTTEFNEEAKDEKKRFENIKSQTELAFQTIAKTPDIGFEQVAAAQKTAHEEELVEIENHYAIKLKLAEKFRQDTKQIEEDREKDIAELTKAALEDDKKIYDSFFKDIERNFEKNVNQIDANLATLKDRILSSSSSSIKQTSELSAVDKVEKLIIASSKLDKATQVLRQKELDFNTQIGRVGVINQSQIDETVTHIDKLQQTLGISEKLLEDAEERLQQLKRKFALSERGVTQEQINDAQELVTQLRQSVNSNIIDVQHAISQVDELKKKLGLQTQFITQDDINILHVNAEKAKEEVKALVDDLNSEIRKFTTPKEALTSVIGSVFFKVDQSSVTRAKSITSQINDINTSPEEKAALQKELNDLTKDVSKRVQLQKLLGDTIAKSFSVAQDAMNNYFDAEKNRIEASTKLIEKRIDLENEQLKNRAQSDAERNTLDREAAAKKDAVEREAFEKSKKIQLAQAKVNLAIELANLAVTASAPGPANFLTLGVAGQVLYLVEAALAFARYAFNVSAIQSSTFARGGRLFERGGSVTSRFERGGSVTKEIYIKEDKEYDKVYERGKVYLKEVSTYEKGGKVYISENRLYEKGGNIYVKEERIFEKGGKLLTRDLGSVYIQKDRIFEKGSKVYIRDEKIYEKGGKVYSTRDSSQIANIMRFEKGGSATVTKTKEKVVLVTNNAIYEKARGMKRKDDEEEEFASGGSPDFRTTRGGRVKGRSHADGGNQFIFKGRIFEDEVDELNIIRTKNAPKGIRYQVEGTQEQIASYLNEIGGGVKFSHGAVGRKLEFGGSLQPLGKWDAGGSVFSLSPPLNPASLFNNDSHSNGRLEKLIGDVAVEIGEVNKRVSKQTENLNILASQTNNRIDKIKVQVVAKEVIDKDKSIRKASAIGTI